MVHLSLWYSSNVQPKLRLGWSVNMTIIFLLLPSSNNYLRMPSYYWYAAEITVKTCKIMSICTMLYHVNLHNVIQLQVETYSWHFILTAAPEFTNCSHNNRQLQLYWLSSWSLCMHLKKLLGIQSSRLQILTTLILWSVCTWFHFISVRPSC